KNADYILEEIKKEKISPLVIKDKKKGSDYSTILLNSSGERTVLVYYGASSGLNVSEVPFDKIKSKWAYIAPGDISFQTIEKIFSHFSKNKTFIAFNPSKRFIGFGLKKLKPLLDQTEVLILNLEEGAALTGINYKKEKEIFEKLDRAEKGIAVMTNGPKGVVVSGGKNIYRAGVFPGKIVDRLGAGDAFGSGFVTGLIQYKIQNTIYNIQDTIKYAIRLGSANATSVVGKIGAKEGILTKKEFNDKKWDKLKILCHTKK
ncbi:MAG: carbohydrate kinase family protein, partial [Spirochaetia bacterium]